LPAKRPTRSRRGLTSRPALCGQDQAAPGWALAGFTSADLDRISCDDCRTVAQRMVEGVLEASAMLEGRRA
jgi:hypothetical protein